MNPIPSVISRKNYPIFQHRPNLVYLDNAATQQLHRQTVNYLSVYHQLFNSNSSRGLYELSVRTDEMIDATRTKVRDFLSANPKDDIIFTKNTTESLNLLALSLTPILTSDDEIIIFASEHHSNLLPWLELARRTGARLNILESFSSSPPDYEGFVSFLTPNVRIVAVSGMSNVTGFKPDLAFLSSAIRDSYASQALLVIDAAQLVAHDPKALHDVDYDAVAFSGHKLGAPMGTGVLCLRAGLLSHLSPVFVGGGTVDSVHLSKSPNSPMTHIEVIYQASPARFEAGTPNVGGIIGLNIALTLLDNPRYSLSRRQKHESALLAYLLDSARSVPHLKVHFAENGIFTFNLDDVHPHDVAQLLAEDNICVRAGYHCAQPLHDLLDLGPTVRASLSWYNNSDDIDRFIESLKTVRERMGL